MSIESNLKVLGVGETKSITFANNNEITNRDFMIDGQNLANFMIENLPAITLTVMIRKLLEMTNQQ